VASLHFFFRRFITAGFQSKHREGHEKISDIYGPKQREGQAYRFKKREMMGVAVWPKGYEEAQKARQAKCFNGPKPYPGYEKFYEEREITIREAYEAKIKKEEEDRIRREEEDKPIDIVELNKRQAHLLVPKKEPEDEPKEEEKEVKTSGEGELKAIEEEGSTEEPSSLAAEETSSKAAEEPSSLAAEETSSKAAEEPSSLEAEETSSKAAEEPDASNDPK